MRFVVIAALLIGGMVFVRWLTFTNSDGSVSATVDTVKVKEDTSEAVEKGKELLDDGIDRLKEAGQKTTGSEPDVPEPDVPEPDVPERRIEELQQE
jgi:hypothetical protein